MKIKAFILTFLIILGLVPSIAAQGDGPRAHLLAPKGIWALNPKYLHLNQNLLPAGNILVKNADLSINVFPTTIVHTFGIKGRLARVFVMGNPGSLEGKVETNTGISESINTSGWSDGFVAFELGLIGANAISVSEFSDYVGQFSLMGFFRYWYSGTYNSENLVNMGTNRSTFEIGTTMSIPLFKQLNRSTWLEVFPTVQFFTANNDPARGNSANKVEQLPLFIIENHLTHNLSKKLWAGLNLRYQLGGETKADGVSDDNQINMIGGGVSLGYQIIAPISMFAGYNTVLYGSNGAESNMLRVSLVFVYANTKK